MCFWRFFKGMHMITDGFTYVAVLLFIAGALLTLEKTAKGPLEKFFRYLPSAVLCYLVAMLLCTLKVWDLGETRAAYGALKNNLTYAMIFAMLLRCNLRNLLRLGPRMLLGFLSASLTIIVGFIAAFLMMKRFIGADAWMGLGALCGSWIGGSGNMVAVQAALNIDEGDMGYALVIDSIVYSLWVMFLLWAVQLAPRFNKWAGADTTQLDEVSSRLEDEAKLNTKRVTLQSLLLLIGCAFLVSAVASNVGGKLYVWTGFSDKATWTVLFVTAVSMVCALTPLGRVAGSNEVSGLLLYAVICLLASRASLLELRDAPAWILTGFIVLVIHAVLMLLLCRLLRLDLFTAGVASLANIGGTASAPVLAGAYAGALVPVGILMALMGYVVGTPLATICANIMKALA